MKSTSTKLDKTPRLRLRVFRSTKHIYAQLIDDVKQHTLAASSDEKLKGTKVERAHAVGKALGESAMKLKIGAIRFDRGSYRYHGRVKAVAEGARAAGLVF